MEFTQRLKNSNFWSFSLEFFNIKLENRDIPAFFGIHSKDDLSTPDVSSIIWNDVSEPKGVPISKPDMDFFMYLGDLKYALEDEVSPLNDFVVFLLGRLDYDAGSRIIHTQTELSFCALDSKVDVTADVSILKRTGGISEYVLLVMGEMTSHPEGAEGRLIAGAVAAFCQNNLTRKQAGFPCLDSQTILGIVMTRTQPTFYKIPVNQAFVHQLLEEGKFPAEPMFVERLNLRVKSCPGSARWMEILEGRWISLKVFNAFRRFLDDGDTR